MQVLSELGDGYGTYKSLINSYAHVVCRMRSAARIVGMRKLFGLKKSIEDDGVAVDKISCSIPLIEIYLNLLQTRFELLGV